MRQAHPCFVREQIAAFEIGYAAIIDEESATTIKALQKASTQNVPAGRWRTVQGRGMRQVHIFCFVREHVAAVEVGYAATSDIEPAAIAILCRRQAHETFQRGTGGKGWGTVEAKHT